MPEFDFTTLGAALVYGGRRRTRVISSDDHGGLQLATSEFEASADVAVPASFQKVSVGRQVLRRELNDRISARDASATEFEVFCECGRAGCRDGALITREAYETLRRVPTHFLIKRSHAAPTERVVDSYEDFLVVEKFGPGGLEAIQLERAGHLPSKTA